MQFQVRTPNGFESAAANTLITLDERPYVKRFEINGAETVTASQTVELTAALGGSPTQFIAGQEPDLTDGQWRDIEGFGPFTLRPVIGEQTVYAKFRDEIGESELVSDTIILDQLTVPDEEPFALLSFVLEGGSAATAAPFVSIDYVARGRPSHFRIAELDSFAAAVWQPIAAPILFELSPGAGEKTVCLQLMQAPGGVQSYPLYSDSRCDAISARGAALCWDVLWFNPPAAIKRSSSPAWCVSPFRAAP